MTSNNTPLDLCGKMCAAVAAYISTDQILRTIPVVPQVTEEPKLSTQITVSARRGSMVGQDSGAWNVSVTLELLAKRIANRNSDVTFQRRYTALAALFEKDFKSTVDKITSCYGGELYIYHMQWEGDDKTPLNEKHRYEVNLNFVAMPVSFKTGLQNLPVDNSV